MGGGRPLDSKEREELRLRLERQKRQSYNIRKAFAEELAMELSSLICEKVIRPGPKPEERACTDVANELTLIEPDIVKVIYDKIFPKGYLPSDHALHRINRVHEDE